MTLQISHSGNRCKELLQAGISHYVDVHSESGYRNLISECPPPDGYVWQRTPFGSQQGRWKAVISEAPDPDITATGLEESLRSNLQSWGYWTYFEHDYHTLGRQLDFADSDRKIALEPGAVYWHTPDGCQGEAVDHVGEHPSDVYRPVKSSDNQKQETLRSDGWTVLWVTETGVNQHEEKIKQWLEKFY